MRAVIVEECGGPEKLTLREVPKPVPGPTDVIVKVAVSGVNFIDVYFRTGLYKLPPPVAIGSEAAGLVDSPRTTSPGRRSHSKLATPA